MPKGDELWVIRETGRWAIAELAARGYVVASGRDGLPELHAVNPTPWAAEFFMTHRLAIAVAMGANQLILSSFAAKRGEWGEEEGLAARSWVSYHRRVQLRCGCIQTDHPYDPEGWIALTLPGHVCRLGDGHHELVEMAELEEKKGG